MRDWDDAAPTTHASAAYDNNDDDNSPAEDLAAIARVRRQEGYGSLASLSHFPPHEEPPQGGSAPPGTKKAKLHRKRHVPVGPAGVWFQAHHRGVGVGTAGRRRGHPPHHPRRRDQERDGFGGEDGNDRRSDDPTEDDSLVRGNEDLHLPPRRDRPAAYGETDAIMGMTQEASGEMDSSKPWAGGLSLCSPAWMCMQCDLGLVLPSLPPNLAMMSASDRASVLRTCLPPHYRLLPDLVRRDATRWRLKDRKVLVLVQAIQSLTDNLWTVKVIDETLTCLTAWIQPALVRQEQQRPQPKYVRPGLVWLLSNPTAILVGGDGHHLDNDAGDEGDNTHNVERMLLVSEETIERVWAPSQAKSVPDEAFVAWLEKRNAISASVVEAWEGGRSASPTQPHRASHAHPHPSVRSPDRPSQRCSVEEEDEKDRAPLESFHESDEEEFALQSSQDPRIHASAAPLSRPTLLAQARQSNRSSQRDPFPSSETPFPTRVEPDPTAAQRTVAEAGTNARACPAGFAAAAPTRSVTHQDHRGLSSMDSCQASIPRLSVTRPASCNDTRVLEPSTSGETCRPVVNANNRSEICEPRPPFANFPIPREPARSSWRFEGRGACQTFGFSQFLSQQPEERPNLAGSVDRMSSNAGEEPEACTTPPPPAAGIRRRDSAAVSSKSKKKRRKRSSSVGNEKSPTNQKNSTPCNLTSMLWSLQAGSSSLLGMFDEDDDDDDVESLFPSRRPAASSVVLADEDSRSIDTLEKGMDAPPQPSLFDDNLGLTLNDMFSDDDG